MHTLQRRGTLRVPAHDESARPGRKPVHGRLQVILRSLGRLGCCSGAGTERMSRRHLLEHMHMKEGSVAWGSGTPRTSGDWR